jgi:ADP-heptose:LPS heptosyltransferase
VKILAIRLARFGDIVLLLPALTLLKAQLPESHLTFLTDERWEALARMCPAIDEVITVNRLGMRDGPKSKAIVDIWELGQTLRKRAFDVAIDCHGFRESSLLAWWSGAPKRLGLRRFDQSYLGFCFNTPPVDEDKSIHVSEMFRRLVRALAPDEAAPVTLAPSIVVPAEARAWAEKALPAQPHFLLFVDAPVPERRWPLKHFAAIARYIASHWKAPVVVVGGGQVEVTPAQFGEDVSVHSSLTIPHLAATVASAAVMVSNDTGPMHLGPALGVPTLGIFSVGLPEHFRPHGVNDEYVRGNPIETVTEQEVMERLDRLWTLNERVRSESNPNDR